MVSEPSCLVRHSKAPQQWGMHFACTLMVVWDCMVHRLTLLSANSAFKLWAWSLVLHLRVCCTCQAHPNMNTFRHGGTLIPMPQCLLRLSGEATELLLHMLSSSDSLLIAHAFCWWRHLACLTTAVRDGGPWEWSRQKGHGVCCAASPMEYFSLFILCIGKPLTSSLRRAEHILAGHPAQRLCGVGWPPGHCHVCQDKKAVVDWNPYPVRCTTSSISTNSLHAFAGHQPDDVEAVLEPLACQMLLLRIIAVAETGHACCAADPDWATSAAASAVAATSPPLAFVHQLIVPNNEQKWQHSFTVQASAASPLKVDALTFLLSILMATCALSPLPFLPFCSSSHTWQDISLSCCATFAQVEPPDYSDFTAIWSAAPQGLYRQQAHRYGPNYWVCTSLSFNTSAATLAISTSISTHILSLQVWLRFWSVMKLREEVDLI